MQKANIFVCLCVTVQYKKYVSAYDRGAAEDKTEYYCEVCEKNLNGPHPYRAHMTSKAHKEMVEYMESYS